MFYYREVEVVAQPKSTVFKTPSPRAGEKGQGGAKVAELTPNLAHTLPAHLSR